MNYVHCHLLLYVVHCVCVHMCAQYIFRSLFFHTFFWLLLCVLYVCTQYRNRIINIPTHTNSFVIGPAVINTHKHNQIPDGLVMGFWVRFPKVMMSFICSCRNKNQPKAIFSPRVLPTIRDCLEGLALMISKSWMVLAAPGLLLTPPPSSSPAKTPHRSHQEKT